MLLSVLVRVFGETEPTAQSIAPAFWILGGISLLAVLSALALAHDAGASLRRRSDASTSPPHPGGRRKRGGRLFRSWLR